VKTTRALLLILATTVLEGQSREVFAARKDPSAAIPANNDFALEKAGDYENALKHYDAVIRRNPSMWAAYYNRARLFMQQGKWELAIQDLNTCIGFRFFVASIMRAGVNERLGRYERSLTDYNRVLSVQPRGSSRALALNSRAWLRATCHDPAFRNGKEAIKDASAACNMTKWKNSNYLDTLAAAYAEDGDFESAVRYVEKAISVCKDADEREALQKRLAMYRKGQPFRR
jgi:tetratricopeptide (TPR) repeat protein